MVIAPVIVTIVKAVAKAAVGKAVKEILQG